MDRDRILTLMEVLGCRPRPMGREVKGRCPFPENHGRGDRFPSFFIKVVDDGWSPYICFGCHKTGMAEHLAINNGRADLVPSWVCKEEQKTWFRKPMIKRPVELPVTFDERYLEPFIGTASGYILNRGISVSTAKTWELGIDRKNIRTTFTVRDFTGKFAVLIGRDVNKTKESPIKYTNYLLDKRLDMLVPWRDYGRADFSYDEYVSPTKSHFLYGEHFAVKVRQSNNPPPAKKNLVVVEGAIDALRLWQAGYNVVAIMGSSASEHQISKLKMFLPKGGKIVLMLDGDSAGRDGSKLISKEIGNTIPFVNIDLPDGVDPGCMNIGEISDCFSKVGIDT